MKQQRWVIVLIFFVWSLSVLGIKKDRQAWILSEFVPNSALSNQLVKAEKAAGNNNFKEAVQLLSTALKLDDVESKQYMKRINNDGPVSLQIEFAKTDYMFKSPYYSNKKAASEAERVIKKYAEQNKGNNWWSYRELYNLIINHNSSIQNIPRMLAYMKQLSEMYPPFSVRYITTMFQKKRPEKKIRDALRKMRADGAEVNLELQILELKLDRRVGKDTYEKLMKIALGNPDINAWLLKDALNEVRKQLDVKNPARIKDFHKKMRKLAMIQPPDKDGMEKVQWCMQERSKLEGLVPECFGVKKAGE
jgi:hypothetical protein